MVALIDRHPVQVQHGVERSHGNDRGGDHLQPGYRSDRQGVLYNERFAHLAKLLRLWPKSIRPDPYSSVITDGLSILKPSPMSDGPPGVRSLSRWFSSSAATRSGRGPW